MNEFLENIYGLVGLTGQPTHVYDAQRMKWLVFSLLGVALGLIPLNVSAQEKFYLRGSNTPTSGSISKVDDVNVYVTLAGGVGGTAFARANIERVELPKPAGLDSALKAAAKQKWADVIAGLEATHTKYRGLPEPWLEDATATLGEAYLGTQQWQKAADLFISMRRHYPRSRQREVAISGHAQAMMGLKQTEPASKLLEALVAEGDKILGVSEEQSRALGKAHLTLGRCYLAAGKNEQALESFLKTTTLYYESPVAVSEALYESALLFEKLNNTVRAQGQLEQMLREYPDSSMADEAKKKLELLKTSNKSTT